MDRSMLETFRLPAYRELPAFGLYLDQAVKYVNGYLTPLGLTELTPSMVSNYVKLGILTAPVKKQYDAEQLAHLFFIAVAKTVLSMDDIKRAVRLHGKVGYSPTEAYDYFCSALKVTLCDTFGISTDECTPPLADSKEKTMIRSVIAAVSHWLFFQANLAEYPSDTP